MLQQLVQRLRTLRQRNEEAMLQAEEQPPEGGQLVEQLALQITDLESADRSLTQRIEDCLEKTGRVLGSKWATASGL